MITETQIQVAGLYQGVLGRLPDSVGFAAYVSSAETSGVSAVIDSMIGGQEFAGYYGEPDPSSEAWSTSFVQALYYNFLAREADAVGLEAYTTSLVDGTSTVAEVVAAFLSSSEFESKSETAITNWYTNYELYTEAGLSPNAFLTADSLSQNVDDVSVNAGVRGFYGVVTQLSDEIDASKLAPSHVFVVDTLSAEAPLPLVGVAGRNPSAGGEIDGALYPATLQVQTSTQLSDGMFAEMQTIQKLELLATDEQLSVTLDENAQAAGIVVVDAAASTAGATIDASEYTVAIKAIGGSGDDSITLGSGANTVSFANGSLTVADTVNAGDGTGTNTLEITGNGSAVTDDDLANVQNVQALSFDSQTTVAATLGSNAQNAGIAAVDASAQRPVPRSMPVSMRSPLK